MAKCYFDLGNQMIAISIDDRGNTSDMDTDTVCYERRMNNSIARFVRFNNE